MDGLLSNFYNAKEIYIETSNTNRTIMSLMSHMMGLYPLGTGSDFDLESNPEQIKQATPPFFVGYENLDSSVLPSNYQPIEFNVRTHYDNLVNAYYDPECPARVGLSKV